VRPTILRLAAAVLLLITPSACRRHEPPPVGDGPRLVVLSPAAAVTLRDLGLSHLAVARHAYDIALDPALPVCGDQLGIDYEALLRIRPTHIIIQWGAREHPPRLADLARRHGWRLLDHNPLTLDDIIADADRLHDEFRAAGPTSAMVHPPPRPSEWIPRRFDALGQSPFDERVLMLAALDPPAALGPRSFHHDVLVRLGGTPALNSGGPYQTLDAEDILRLAPDLIVLILPRTPRSPPPPPPDPGDLRARLGRLGMLDIPAIRRGRVVLFDDPEFLTPSTAVVRFAEALARALYPLAADTLAPHARPAGDPR
jgi:ABC-type Fe3+-hydroxamate transport system substrate-binding protein